MKLTQHRFALQALCLIALSVGSIATTSAADTYGRASYYRADHRGTTASGE